MDVSDESAVADGVVAELRRRLPSAEIVARRYSAPGEVWSIDVSRVPDSPVEVAIVIEYFDHISNGLSRHSLENYAESVDERIAWLVDHCLRQVAQDAEMGEGQRTRPPYVGLALFLLPIAAVAIGIGQFVTPGRVWVGMVCFAFASFAATLAWRSVRRSLRTADDRRPRRPAA